MNKDYSNYGSIELATDHDFLQHFLSPNTATEKFWKNWLINYPEKLAVWEDAHRLVEAVQLGLTDYTRTYLTREAEEALLQRIWETNNLVAQERTKELSYWNRSRMMAAATALAVASLGAFWFMKEHPSQKSLYETHTSSISNSLIEEINTSQSIKHIYLPDSSQILLSPSSKISFSRTYGSHDRNIYLTGKATFDVRKNPQKPFRVFANELITKVLGTRFEVSAYEKGKDVIVKVQSGQVSVYQEKEYTNSMESKSEKAGVLLLTNQQVIFKRQSEQFNKLLVDQPTLLTNSPAEQFVYDERPVIQVLKDIEAAYGVDIVYSDELLQNCDLTANLTDEPFRGKLDIICRSLGASYEIVEAQIIITAQGCKNTKN